MLNQIRLMFIALLMSVFLVACGDEGDKQEAMTETAEPAAEMSAETATEAEMPAEDAITGMTHEEAVAKWGEPDVTETRTIDALTITHNEWHGDDGITAVQFENGVATYHQFIPAK